MKLKDSLNLPKTDFPMRANLPQNEPLKIESWKENKIYETIKSSRFIAEIRK